MAAVASRNPVGTPSGNGPGRSGTLGRLLAGAASGDPDALAFRDQPERSAWCGRESRAVTRAVATAEVGRLASFLASLDLEPDSPVGISLPNGYEACLSLLAVAEAGLTPCLFDPGWTAGQLSKAIEAAEPTALITQTVLGRDRPADKLGFVAAGFRRLRCLLAYGPGVPAGMTDLDAVMAVTGRDVFARAEGETDPVTITFARRGGDLIPVRRTHRSLIAAAAVVVAAARIRPSDRIVSLLTPDDLKGLATGLVAALAAGAAFEPHGIFSASSLLQSLVPSSPVHLVVPEWMEAALSASELGDDLRSTILVHEPPYLCGDRPGLAGRVVDALACDELAVLAAVRGASRKAAPVVRPMHGAAAGLIETRLDDGADIWLRGAAVSADPGRERDGWIASGLVAESRDGVMSAVRHRTS